MILRDLNQRAPGARPLVIGHRGAARLAPENSLEGFAAAVDAGADLVEFDVCQGLVVGHPGVAPSGAPPLLDDALEYLAATSLGIHIDLKLDGAEREIAAAVRRFGVETRTMVSTPLARSLRRFELEAPAITRAITYPQDRHGASAVAWPGAVVRVSAAGLREAMRVRAPLLLAAGHGHVLTLHHALVSAAVVRGAQRRGAAVVAWTVNDPLRVTALARLGVDAIVSDDPRMVVDALATL